MASSNRHWPSMFKSKPCNQPWHDINTPPLLTTTCMKSHLSSGYEEKTPEPKPRWNPKPEQIRILEAIFNSGMVNPPREEIHRIRLQLQQYGQVGDANVFYWFQNRKSRTKNKHRQQSSTRANYRPSVTNINTPSNTSIANANIDALNNGMTVGALNNNRNSVVFPSAPMAVSTTMTTPTSSSSSSSERSSGSSKPLKPTHAPINLLDPVNQIYNNFHGSVELAGASEPSLIFQNPHTYCFSIPELTSLIAAPEHLTGEGLGLWTESMNSTGVVSSEEEGVKFKNDSELHYGLGLWSDLINQAECKGLVEGQNGEDKARIGLLHDCSFGLTSPNVASTVAESVLTASVPAASRVPNVSRCQNMVTSSPPSEIQGFGNGDGMGDLARLTVFINNVAYDMPAARLNVKSVFGSNAVLVHASSGYPVPIDELANTLQPLQHGAAYYVVS